MNNNRIIIYIVSLGAAIYALAMMGSVTLMMIPELIITRRILHTTALDSFLDGLMMITAVVFGSVLLWWFACERKSRQQLFIEEDSVKSAVFGKTAKMSIGRLLQIAAFVFAMQMVCMVLLDMLETVLNVWGYTAKQTVAATSDDTASITAILYAVVIGPAAEELVYRGFIMKGLKPCGKTFAIVVSALMFGFMHGDIYQLIFTLVAGVILGYVAMEYSILASYILHVINNGVFSTVLDCVGGVSVYAYNAAVIILTVAGAAVAYRLFANRARVKAYIKDNLPVAGTWRFLLNRYFVAFMAFFIVQTINSVVPL